MRKAEGIRARSSGEAVGLAMRVLSDFPCGGVDGTGGDDAWLRRGSLFQPHSQRLQFIPPGIWARSVLASQPR